MDLILCLVLLFGISVLIQLLATWIKLGNTIIHAEILGQAIILFLRVFLYKISM